MRLQVDDSISLARRRAIWLTDAYAIRDFISGWRLQIIAVYNAPTNLRPATISWMLDCIYGNKRIIRKIPYPPNFRRIPARIILPATGASTWALGSHR